AEQRGMSRAETRPFAQRLGVEIALLAVAAVAMIQLRFYGAPLTRTVQGSLGLDPLLVAAPAIGLLAGGILALRILPILAQWAEAAISRRRDLVGSLGSRQLARRPLRYTRSALLLMLALSMGVFSISYVATWSGSQRDQAAYQAGASIRVTPSHAKDAPSGWALPAAYRAIPGVGPMSPVERRPGGLDYANRSADLMTVDADTAAGIVLFRTDESSVSLASLMATLRDGRPTQGLLALPAGTAFLRVTPHLEITSISTFAFDPATGEGQDRPLDPAKVDVGLRVSAIVREPGGVLDRVQSDVASSLAPRGPITLALGAGGGDVQIAGLGIDILLPNDTLLGGGTLGIGSVEAAPAASGPWTPVPVDGVGPWSASFRQGRQAPQAIPADQLQGLDMLLGGGPTGAIFGDPATQPSGQITFIAASLAPPDVVLPAIVNRAFLSKTSAGLGDTFAATFEGGVRRLRIAGVVEDFPTTDPSSPLVILDESTLGMVRLRLGGTIRDPDEWWLATTGDSAGVAAALTASPFRSASVTTAADRTRSLSTDPIAVGIIGALILGFVATGLVALVGLAVSAAVSARQRRTEFALLRALGLSGGQLSGWLWLENGSLVLVSLVGGTALGVLIGWLVLPFVTVTQQAAAPVPPVLVHVPWDGVILLDLASAVAAGLAVIVIGAVLRRRGVGSVLRMGED
ncbi:MAG TPA: FtsX-like permease family protein, partial [Candidatus Limnocylindrales bacterium]|nr:FtsX-like permease family protein [Candidatus Limnocylindrales bacterium]